MPFGLCNATATFQRLMNRVLEAVEQAYGNLVLCYVDDILIATATINQHIVRMEETFACLKKAGLKLKASKCAFLKKSGLKLKASKYDFLKSLSHIWEQLLTRMAFCL